MRLVVVVPFLDEEANLPALLASFVDQERRPDRLLLVDDGSTDGSARIATEFAEEHAWASVLQVPPRPRERDRMLQAHELQAVQWAMNQVEESWDAVGKVDADLVLRPGTLAELERRLASDERLGIVGALLRDADGSLRRCPDGHVEGALAVYRRECWTAIEPLPPIIGWDTIDEVRARLHGFQVATFRMPDGDPLHRRPMGSYDGLLRGYRRAGLAAWAYGADPVVVLASSAWRCRHKPYLLCGLNYLGGWLSAGARRAPRAEPEVRARVRREHRARLRALADAASRAR